MEINILYIQNQFQYTPIWLGKNRANIDPITDIISDGLSADILAWDDTYQEAFNKCICSREKLSKFLDIQEFNKKGQILCDRISNEQPKYTVIFERLEDFSLNY